MIWNLIDIFFFFLLSNSFSRPINITLFPTFFEIFSSWSSFSSYFFLFFFSFFVFLNESRVKHYPRESNVLRGVGELNTYFRECLEHNLLSMSCGNAFTWIAFWFIPLSFILWFTHFAASDNERIAYIVLGQK